MLPAAKHLDIVMGIDIHIVNVPAPPAPFVPVPIPHPFIGIIFDSGDYNFAAMAMEFAADMGVDLSPVMDLMALKDKIKSPATMVQEQLEKLKNWGKSQLGISPPSGPATVKINGLPRARAGTKGKAMPKHFPIGGPSFTKGMPSNTCEMFMGSLSVSADGEPLSFMGCMVLSCQCVGMPVPFRPKGSAQGGFFLPTSVVMSIPLGLPVLVGGAPVPSLNVFLNKLFDAAFAAALAKLRSSAAMAAISQAIQNAAGRLMNALGVPADSILRNIVADQICDITGHPVDIATGKVFTKITDFVLPGLIPLSWDRVWFSTSVYDGSFGYGWHWKYDISLAVDENDTAIVVRLSDGRVAIFPPLKVGESEINQFECLSLHRDNEGYVLRDKQGIFYRFKTYKKVEDSLIYALNSVENAAGHTISFDYNVQGHLAQITDTAGKILKITCNPRGKITTVEAPHPDRKKEFFVIAAYRYDSNNHLIEVKDALGQPFTYEYRRHLLVKETNRIGLSFYFDYDGMDENARCTRTWGDNGIYDHKLTYNLVERWTIVENSLGVKTKYNWTEKGVVWKVTDTEGYERFKRYTTKNQLQSEINELGLITSYDYDKEGNQSTIVYPDGSSVTTQYQDSLPMLVIDPNGGAWQWTYNEHRQVTSRTNPLGLKTTYQYEKGLLRTITNPAGGVTKLTFDASKYLVALTLPDGAISRWEYDNLGRCTAYVDAKGNMQRRRFDLLGRAIQVDETDGNRRIFKYDAESNVVQAKDNQHDIAFEYKDMNRLKARTEGGTRVEFKYNTEGDLLGIINEFGYAYRFELDSKGNVVVESGFDGVTRQFKRDAAGRVMEAVRSGGKKTVYDYDLLGRIIKTTHGDGSFEQFAYRNDGAIIEATNKHIAVKFERDALGRVVKEWQGTTWIASEYDLNGRRTSIKSSLGANVQLSRNIMGDVETITADDNGKEWAAQFKHDITGLELERLLPGGVRSEWKRDRLGRPLEQSTSTTGGKATQNRQYVWDVNDRLKQIIDEQKGTYTFEHDTFGNLASAQYPDGSFEYRTPDAVGNLFRRPDRSDRKYGPAGQLLEAEGTRYEYDPEGNLIRKTERQGGIWLYEWDEVGMLRKVVRPDGFVVSFAYDALGRRIYKIYRSRMTR